MPTYVSLLNWTDQGIRNFRDTVERADAARAQFEQLGLTLKEVYWTVGPYDIVTIAEAPDEETATAALLALGSQGNIRSTTMLAHDRDSMSRILEKLG